MPGCGGTTTARFQLPVSAINLSVAQLSPEACLRTDVQTATMTRTDEAHD